MKSKQLKLKNVSEFCTSPFLNFLLRHQQIEHCEEREIERDFEYGMKKFDSA